MAKKKRSRDGRTSAGDARFGGKNVESSSRHRIAATSTNQFDVFQNRRRRHAVLGERVRGERRDMVKSRAAANRERTTGLMKEALMDKRTSTFKDARIGVGETGDSEGVQRLVKLRQRQAKRTFSLEGVDANRDGFTIGGRPLAEVGDDELKASGGPGSESEDDKGALQGEEDFTERSKRLKREAAKEKAEQEFKLENLDADFGDIMGELKFRPPKAMALRLPKEPLPPGTQDGPDGYDKLVRQLGLERKAAASERVKSVEEIAQERAERLEELEKERLLRASGNDEGLEGGGELAAEEVDQSIVYGVLPLSGVANTKDSAQMPSDARGHEADNLEVFDEEEEDEAGEGMESEEEDEDDGDDENDMDAVQDNGNPESAADLVEADDADDAAVAGGGCLCLLSAADAAAVDHMVNGKGEEGLPFSFQCPAEPADVDSLLRGKPPKTALKIVQRIRTCTAVTLHLENRAKLRRLFQALLTYIIDSAARDDGDISATGIQLLYAMRPVLVEMAVQFPEDACEFFSQRLHKLELSTLPRASEVVCMKLVALIFPVSDYTHPITTPASVLVDHWASRIAALGAGLTDLVSDALMLWEVLYSFLAPEQRFSASFFTLGAALLESCWASAAAGRKQCVQAAADISKLLLEIVEVLADTDPAVVHITIDSILRPSLERAASAAAAAKASESEQSARNLLHDLELLAKRRPLQPLQLFQAPPPQIRLLDPIFHEVGDRPTKGAELTETKRLKKRLNEERRAANRQLARDASVVQLLQVNRDDKRRTANSAEKVRVRGILEAEKQMLAKLKTESGGGMDTSIASYTATKAEKKANKRLGGNVTDASKRTGTPKDPRRPKRPTKAQKGEE